jgi:hypothetical protein
MFLVFFTNLISRVVFLALGMVLVVLTFLALSRDLQTFRLKTLGPFTFLLTSPLVSALNSSNLQLTFTLPANGVCASLNKCLVLIGACALVTCL